MVKEIDPNIDEYTFSEEEDDYSDAYPVKKSDKVSKFFKRIVKRKAVLIVIGLAVFGYVGYKLMNYMQKKDSGTLSVTETTTKKPAKKEITPSQSTKSQQQATTSQRSQFDQLQNQVQQPSRSTQSINRIQNDISTISNRIAGIQQSVNNLNSNIQRLVYSINVQNNLIRRQLQAQMIKSSRAAAVYYIQAIIPNRAWIVTPRGRTISVAPGSIIPGVGIVTNINAPQGEVVTNTGAVIRYAIKEL